MLDIIITMRVSLCIAIFLMPFLICTAICSAQIHLPATFDADNDPHERDPHTHANRSVNRSERESVIEKPTGDGKSENLGSKRGRKTLQIAGSRLPDCLHACGSCTPCRLVIVSLARASHTEEAESCPISYRCMCNSKSYPVP